MCAVVVTYHPDAQIPERLIGILSQTHQMVVVDNGSEVDEVSWLRTAQQEFGFHLIENEQNLGIAEALNQGVRWAKQQGYLWVILFDQDSRITDGFVRQLFETWESHPNRERVGSVHPRYVNPETQIEPAVWRARDGGPVISLTSGSLLPTWVFDKAGWFASEFFIDEVDTEYCYRLRAFGYLIADSRRAILLHTAGHPKKCTFLGFSFYPMHHNAVRRYYLSRNRILLFKRYFRVFPLWILQSANVSLRETVKCFLGEQNRARKFRNFLLGTWDGMMGKSGKREGI